MTSTTHLHDIYKTSTRHLRNIKNIYNIYKTSTRHLHDIYTTSTTHQHRHLQHIYNTCKTFTASTRHPQDIYEISTRHLQHISKISSRCRCRCHVNVREMCFSWRCPCWCLVFAVNVVRHYIHIYIHIYIHVNIYGSISIWNVRVACRLSQQTSRYRTSTRFLHDIHNASAKTSSRCAVIATHKTHFMYAWILSPTP